MYILILYASEARDWAPFRSMFSRTSPWSDRMKAKPVTYFASLFGLLIIAMPVVAHHGGVAYETGKRITLKGTITQL